MPNRRYYTPLTSGILPLAYMYANLDEKKTPLVVIVLFAGGGRILLYEFVRCVHFVWLALELCGIRLTDLALLLGSIMNSTLSTHTVEWPVWTKPPH